MRKIALYTRSGVGNPDSFVGKSVVPPFAVPPDILIFGQRFFRYFSTKEDHTDVYVEAFSFWLTEKPTDEE